MKHVVALLTALILCVACGRQSDSRSRVQQLVFESEQRLEADDIDSAWVLLEHAYDYAAGLHDDGGRAEALLAMARHHNMMDRPDSALSCLRRGLDAWPQAPDSLLAQYYAELSATSNVMGDMAAAVEWGRLALPLMQRYGSSEDYAIMCGNTGIAYRRLGQNDSAAICYQQGLEAALAAGDHDSEAYLANNLSVLFAEMGRLDESLGYADKAIAAATAGGDDVERLSAQANKGIALLMSHRDDEAVSLLTATFEAADSTDSTPLKLKTINYLLKALSSQPAAPAVSRYLQRGEEIAAQLPPGNTAAAGILESRMIILTEQGRYAEALQTISRLEELMQLQQVIPPHKLLGNKSRCLAALGRYDEAYRLEHEAAVLADSLHSAESQRRLDELATNYRVMEKELEVAQLSARQARSQRSIGLLAAALAVLVAAVVAMAVWMRQRRQKAQMRETRKYVEGMEQERSRFAHELHDGACNDLLAIGMQLRTAQPDHTAIATQVGTLRSHLRRLSHELMPPQFAGGVTLPDALSHYLSHIETPAVSFRADEGQWQRLPANTSYQLYRIVQEAVGNIAEHQGEQARGSVVLQFGDGQPRLTITSVGKSAAGDGTGIGLQSMTDRAASIGYRLTTESEGDTWTLKVGRD
ncbi:MAG: hypothetical protein IJ176_02120 [Prevotella sp.]|nr:hypothetical protein [Prevotella sp.]